MLPLRFIRENSDSVKQNIIFKGQNQKVALVDELLSLDTQWRKEKKELDDARKERNTLSEAINAAKKQKKDASEYIAKAKELPAKIKALEPSVADLEEKILALQKQIPNILHKDVPKGKDDSENVVRRQWGKIRSLKHPVAHSQLAENLGIADFESSARVAGNGFYFLEGDLALLNQALIRFGIEMMVKKGYTYVETPLMVRQKIIDGVMTFKEMDDMIYRIEGEDLVLIGTSEHSLIGKFIDQTIPEEQLPLRLTSYSVCFRKEIGSHGIDEKGLWRTHQFNKVEQVIICKPEDSWKLFEELLQNTEDICQALGLPYQVLEMCTGDLGDMKARQYDVEAWLPRKNGYGEIGSCSNLTNNQAVRLNIRYLTKKNERDFAHTLNNTALATSRMMVALLENFQNDDGTVDIPKVLQPLMFGKKKIVPKKS